MDLEPVAAPEQHAIRVHKNAEAAEDAVQEVFV